MNAGRIEQIGSPREVYNRPRTRFVADFIGDINLLEGEWRDGAFVVNRNAVPAPAAMPPGPATIAIRPERVRLTEAGRSMTSSLAEGRLAGIQEFLDSLSDAQAAALACALEAILDDRPEIAELRPAQPARPRRS